MFQNFSGPNSQTLVRRKEAVSVRVKLNYGSGPSVKLASEPEKGKTTQQNTRSCRSARREETRCRNDIRSKLEKELRQKSINKVIESNVEKCSSRRNVRYNTSNTQN